MPTCGSPVGDGATRTRTGPDAAVSATGHDQVRQGADLPAGAIPPHRTWFPDRFNFYVVAFNTTKVQRSQIPSTYEGFADPKWKGRITVEATDAEWMATIVKTWGVEKGTAYFRKLAALRPDVRTGHILLANLVVAGEVPVALTAYNSSSARARR